MEMETSTAAQGRILVIGQWHTQAPEAVMAELGTSKEGLSAQEASRRLSSNGPNEIHESESFSPWNLLLAQFSSLIVWILIVAGVVAGAFGEWLDCIAILVIVLLNAAIGFYQEYSAEKSISALRRMTSPVARVRRDGSLIQIAAREIVTGDIVYFEAGDLICADCRILEANSLRCIEASLTGEAEPVNKAPLSQESTDLPLGDRASMVYMGTSVAVGSGLAVVVSTGMNSELGKIASLIKTAKGNEQTPLQVRLNSFGRLLAWCSLGIVTLVFLLGLVRQVPLFELFLTSISLAVAAVPEGLPAVVTVALALGVQRMARRRALVRKLPAVETLGCTNVICTDKTGTLTVGQMTVRAMHVSDARYSVEGEGYGPEGLVYRGKQQIHTPDSEALKTLLEVMVGCNGATLQKVDDWIAVGDPTEAALLSAARKLGLDKSEYESNAQKLVEFPFDSDRKLMSVVRQSPNLGVCALVKGAPDILLKRCIQKQGPDGVRPLQAQDHERILEENAALADQAMRVLAFAYRRIDENQLPASASDAENALVFVGLVGMYDPPRPEAIDAISRCHSAGIKVVMITGDHPKTALSIARELKIAQRGDQAMTGQELDQLSDAQLALRLPEIALFARVSAEHKLRIVRGYKALGSVVAMTGDGVNDAPAIKGADIGIAMGKGGTEVTKEASDMVITDDNFSSIVAAVEEGRGVYENIRKTLQYLLAGNTAELMLITACVLVGLPMPLLAIHLLWINLVTDGLPALCLATDPIDPDVMNRPPRPMSMDIADRSFIRLMLLTGALTASVTFVVYILALKYESVELARTHAFAVLVFAELLRSFGCRSETKTVFQLGLTTNVRLFLVVSISFLLQLASHHIEPLGAILKTTTMSLSDCALLLLAGSFPLVVLEARKVVSRQPSKTN